VFVLHDLGDFLVVGLDVDALEFSRVEDHAHGGFTEVLVVD